MRYAFHQIATHLSSIIRYSHWDQLLCFLHLRWGKLIFQASKPVFIFGQSAVK